MNLIAEIARRHPREALAVVEGDRFVTHGELFDRAEPVATAIREAAATLGRRPRVGLHHPNGLDYLVLAIGILLADACLVPLAEELTDAERDEITRTTALDFILTGAEAEPVAGASRSSPSGERPAPQPATPAPAPSFHLTRSPHATPPAFPEDHFQALAPAFIRFSSGTTGSSKGVVLSHTTLRARINAANGGMRLGPADRVLWMLPMAHHFAVSIVLYLHSGAVTLLAPSPDPAAVLDLARRHRATVIYGSPFHFAQLAADRGDFDWPGLRLAVATAAALPEATARAFERRFHHPLVQGLGIIEAGLPVLNLEHARERPAALGRPLPGYEVELRDPAGRRVPPGEPGEFHVRGPGLLDAYLVPWDPDPLDDGWFASGDLVRADRHGTLTLVGRVKSVINVGGMKVFPEEIEAVLDNHPGVARSRVHGRDHPQLGQVPVAEILPADRDRPPPSAELRQLCRQRLSAYKIPTRFQTVAELPTTASGKLRRH